MALNSFFSPNGFSVGNLFNPTNVVLANGDITAGNTVTANYFLGNGSFLTGISAGNTTVSNTAPVGAQQGDVWIQANTGIQYIYFTSGGNSQWAEMEAAISISTGGNAGTYTNADAIALGESGWAGNIIPAANVTYSLGNSTNRWANLWLAGNTLYIGNLSIGVTGNSLTVDGQQVLANGSDSSINSTGNITTTANISGDYILGNGAFLTGISGGSSYGNANVANYLPTYTGNLVSLTGNVTTTGNISGGNILGNIRSAVGGYDNANVMAYLPFYTGNLVSLGGPVITSSNVTADYFFGNGAFLTGIVTDINYSNSNVEAYLPTYTGQLPNLTGIIATTANVQANYFIGNIRDATGGYSNANAAAYLQVYNANASFSNIIVSQNLVIEGNLRVNGNTTSINANTLNVGDKDIILANGATQLSDLDGAGMQLGNLASGNVQFFYDFPGNVMTLTHGLSISNRFTVTGNAYISQDLTFNGNLSLSNAGNIIGSSENTQIITNDYTWTFSDLGNLSAPGNVSAAYYYGDISNTTGGYGNDEVTALLSSNSAISIVTSGSIQTTGNITSIYYFGNGAFLTGLPAGYSNADVANYLISYPGNIIPAANGAYNLGNNTNRWNEVYVNSTLYLPFQTFTSNSTRIIASSSLSAYDFISTNDVTAAANITATGNVSGSYILGNIRFATGGYNDANVAAYTGALTNLTGNVTTTANISGAYILGNGAFLTGISGGGSTYGNSNVADYLASNAALTINTTANISTSANVSASNFIGTSPSTVIKTGNFTWTFGSTGSLTVPGNINANNYSINNLANPVQDQDAATKTYVDNLASTAISYHEAVLAATTTTLAVATGGTVAYNQVNGVGNGIGATLTTTGSFNLIDTANVQTANTRILVKNEANGAHNGVYVWSNATAITRAPTENTPGVANVDAFGINDYFYTTSGNINKGSAFIVDAPNTAIVFGTSNIQFAVFSQSQVYSANTAAGISLATTTISAKVDNVTTAFDGSGNISIKAGAVLTTPNIGAATGTSVNVTGNITSSANIAGNYILGNGAFLTGISGGGGGTYSNSNVADYLASNAAVTILTTGNITTSANITANNFIGAAGSDPNVGLIAGSFTWNFDTTGNLTMPGNLVGNSSSNTTIQTGANRWNFASDGQLYLPGNIVAGYRDIPQISWTGTPTIALADLGEHYYTASGGVTINIPANSSVPLPIGAAVTLINQSGANCTIARGTTTLYLAGNATNNVDRILSWYGFATLVKVAADTWFVNGANVI